MARIWTDVNVRDWRQSVVIKGLNRRLTD